MPSTDHGSASWMTKNQADRNGFITTDGITLGYWAQHDPFGYTGEQHLITVAPNRTGKGTCAIVPNLLNYAGGVFVIDPKGENAIITAATRRAMGQAVHILDPWGIAVDRLRDECGFDGSNPDRPPFERAGFNPLDMLKPDSPDLTDDTMMIADALIVSEQGGDSHWSTEAKAALAGFILHVVTSPEEEGQRHLPRVRDILSLPPSDMLDLIENMAESSVRSVRDAANRLKQKTDKELSSVMSTASANTHFLDSDALRESLTRSTFDFGALKDEENPLTVYLVIPSDRLGTHGRWLRLLISMGLTAVSRRKGKPKISALFILDEFAKLGRLAMVEEAFGLMAGYGMRIWAILQDLSQLQDLYQKRWQTFLANAGVFQIFGTNDMQTAEYASRLLGRQTLEVISQETVNRRQGGMWKAAEPHFMSMHDHEFGRELMAVNEIMKMNKADQIVFISGQSPAYISKIEYYENARFWSFDRNAAGKGFFPLYTSHPDFPFDPENPSIAYEADDETRERFRKIFEEDEIQPKRKKKWGFF